MKLAKKIVLLGMVCGLLIVSIPAKANILVAPHRFIFRIDQRNTQVVEITNTSNTTKRLKVYPGKPPEMKEELYLGEWLVLYPPILTLRPGQKRAVRFSVRAPDDLKAGEYRSLLYFEELPQQNSNSNSGKIDFQLLTKLGINLYGRYGQLNFDGKFKNRQVQVTGDELSITGKFVNQGNAHLRMKVRIQIINLNKKENKTEIIKEKKLPQFVVHRNASKEFNQQIQLPAEEKTKVKVIFERKGQIIYKFSRSL